MGFFSVLVCPSPKSQWYDGGHPILQTVLEASKLTVKGAEPCDSLAKFTGAVSGLVMTTILLIESLNPVVEVTFKFIR